MLGTLIDVTERTVAERAVEADARRQKAIATVSTAALEGEPLADVMKHVVTQLAAVLGMDCAKVLELLPGGEQLLLRAGVGWQDGLVGKAKVECDSASQAGFTVVSDGPVVVENLASEKRFHAPRLLSDHKIVSGISVVIEGREQPFGVLGVHSREALTFGEEDIRFVQTMANVLAQLIELRDAEEELRSLNAELERRVERRTAELKDAVEALEAFNSAVSHDLRQPLHTVSGFVGLVRSDAEEHLDENHRDFLDRATAGLKRMGRMMDDLLRLSRLGRVKLRRSTVSLDDIAVPIVEELRRSAPERDVEIIIEPGLEVFADEGMLSVLLQNLIGNAWKFSGNRDQARIEIGAVSPGTDGARGEVAFFVRDNGAGFDMSQAERLFQPFQRLHSQDEFSGTGIGLATVARIVRRHGGTIWAKSAPEQGAAFYFTLGSTAESDRTVGI